MCSIYCRIHEPQRLVYCRNEKSMSTKITVYDRFTMQANFRHYNFRLPVGDEAFHLSCFPNDMAAITRDECHYVGNLLYYRGNRMMRMKSAMSLQAKLFTHAAVHQRPFVVYTTKLHAQNMGFATCSTHTILYDRSHCAAC